MEELHEAAMAYYNNGPEDLQRRALNFFRVMDMDGDGKISSTEFVEFLNRAGYNWIPPNFFSDLDQNGDGGLDFCEVLTLYYVVKTRQLFCNKCRAFLKGLYFTCVTCFDCPRGTYDICLTCYRLRAFHHHHTSFLDNYVMLRLRRGPSVAASTNMYYPPSGPQPFILPQPLVLAPAHDPSSQWREAFEALELGFAAWTIAATTGCIIM